MPRKKKHREPTNRREAVECLMSGLVYFFTNKPIKTGIFFILLLGAPGILLYDYLTTDRVTIETALPIGEEFSIMPEIYAADEELPIKIDGKTYGYRDDEYEVWVLTNNKVLLHHLPSGAIFTISMPDIDVKQYKK